MSTGKFTVYKFGDYEFASRYWETSRAWGHECYLLHDGIGEVGKARYRYYNRTWECYTFQSVMFGAIEDYKKQELARYLNNRKIELGLKGFDEDYNEFDKPWGRGQKKQVIEEFETTEIGKTIKRLKEFVEKRS
jgi:hypothetical protein